MLFLAGVILVCIMTVYYQLLIFINAELSVLIFISNIIRWMKFFELYYYSDHLCLYEVLCHEHLIQVMILVIILNI